MAKTFECDRCHVIKRKSDMGFNRTWIEVRDNPRNIRVNFFLEHVGLIFRDNPDLCMGCWKWVLNQIAEKILSDNSGLEKY